MLDIYAKCLVTAWQPNFPLINDCVLVVSPEHYTTLLRGGVKSKADLKQRLFDKCNGELAPSLRNIVPMAKPDLGRLGSLLGAALGMVSQAKSVVGLTPLSNIPKFKSLDSFHIVVAGGDAGKFSAFLPCFGVGFDGSSTSMLSKPVHRNVEAVPDTVSTTPASFDGVYDVLLPTAEDTVMGVTRAPRRKELEGTVALVDISKPGGSVVLNTIGSLLQARFPNLLVEHFVKPTFSQKAPPELLKTIASRCTTAVIAMAD